MQSKQFSGTGGKDLTVMAVQSTLIQVRVGVTEIGWDGSIRRRVLDTWRLADSDRWDIIVGQVLASPPPYRAAPGRPVYVIHAGDRAVLVSEQDVTGPVEYLVTTVLAVGDPA